MIKRTSAQSLAVSVAEAKAYARIDSTDEDALVESLIRVSQNLIEEYTGRAIAADSKYVWVAAGWPDWSLDRFYRYPAFADTRQRRILLARSPLVSIEAFKYRDLTGALVTLSSGSYLADTFSLPGALVFKGETGLPEVDTTTGYPDSLQIEFTAGEANPILNQAILMSVVHFYENRSPFITGTIVSELPMSVKHLLRSQRIDSLFTS